ncbi:phosphotransferase family protein [Nocardioides coralli]|uniref:phosphotransferase family protein n=1 Tax=Nocardioides coralli TaxID=2872154 RepID=UPI0020173416|nr:phosphotransferase family protein [Nocardioides coralli]
MTDETTAVREEDAVDAASVARWLREHAAEGWRDRLDGTPAMRQFPGGASNITYLLTWPGVELVLRRPPAGTKARGAHDMGREHRIQAALAPAFPLVPEMVAHCEDTAVIGHEFYVMTRVDGVIPRRELGVDLTEQQTATLCGNVWDVLVQLHGVDLAATGLDRLARGEGYVARQVAGWTTRLAGARTDDLGDWSAITSWLDREQPADVASCLVHNDFRLDNLVLSPADSTRVAAVLDWEMATVGDPLMDLGGALAYWVQDDDDETFQRLRRQPSHLPGMWTREQVVDYYGERSGHAVSRDRWRFYEVFGLFRLAVIAQQIWYRYANRQTTNEAYAAFGPVVGALEQRCRRLVGA